VPILSVYDANDCDVRQAKKRKKRILSQMNDFTQRVHQTNKKKNCFKCIKYRMLMSPQKIKSFSINLD